jgi:hypothetical protein
MASEPHENPDLSKHTAAEQPAGGGLGEKEGSPLAPGQGP